MHTEGLISIGDLAAQTGISVDTIRVWERRYGQPVAHRLPSGHRRYSTSDVRRLRRVAEALSLGHRPSRVLELDESALDQLLAAGQAKPSGCHELEPRIGLVQAFDRRGLRTDLERSCAAVGARAFLVDHVLPLAHAVGRSWADGQLQIRHEHFATLILEDVVRGLLASSEDDPSRPAIVLATLPGESHGLGIEVAAVFASLAGLSPRLLGTCVPASEIAAAAAECGAVSVALSISLASGGVEMDREVSRLRDLLAPGVTLYVGGQGARGPRRGPREVRYIDDFERFEMDLGEQVGRTAADRR